MDAFSSLNFTLACYIVCKMIVVHIILSYMKVLNTNYLYILESVLLSVVSVTAFIRYRQTVYLGLVRNCNCLSIHIFFQLYSLKCLKV